MNRFPTTIEEAVDCPDATFVGGGTDLMPLLKNQVRDDKQLVFLSRIPCLHGISEYEGQVRIGATETLTEIAESPLLRRVLPAISQAAKAVASPQIRNIGTIGGNILQDRRCIYFNQSQAWRSAIPLCFKTGGETCHQIPNSPICRAIYYSDVATALLVYNAQVEYLEKGNRRRAALSEVLERYCAQNGREFRERLHILVVCFWIDYPHEGERSGFYKYAMRTSIDFPLINFAIRCGASCAPMAVAGAVGPMPVFLSETAAIVKKGAPVEEVIAACRRELTTAASPIREACISPTRKKDLYAQIAELFPIAGIGKE